MSRHSNYYEQAIELCESKIRSTTSYIEEAKINLANMKDFKNSALGKAMYRFCEEYAKGNFNEALLASIEKMINTPALNPYNFTIDYDEPCDGEKLLYGKKFVTSHKQFGLLSAWFMFYHWDNFDLDKDIKNLERSIEEAEAELPRAKIRLCNAKVGMARFHDIDYSATDISTLEKSLRYAKTVRIINPEGSTFNTIVIIQECIKRGIPVTVVYTEKGYCEQKIKVEDTQYTVDDCYDGYDRPMRYRDYEMRRFDVMRYY